MGVTEPIQIQIQMKVVRMVIRMTSLDVFCTLYYYCSQITTNVCLPYLLPLTVNVYNLTLQPEFCVEATSSVSPN